MQLVQQKGVFSNWMSRMRMSRHVEQAAIRSGCEVDAGGNASVDAAISEVWLHPDSEHLNKQSLMQSRRITKPVFRIGRRTAGTPIYSDENAPDLLIFEASPYTLSKLQCQIEINESGVLVRDLGSRNGTKIGDKRLISPRRKEKVVLVPKGSHALVLGSGEGPFRFRLEVK